MPLRDDLHIAGRLTIQTHTLNGELVAETTAHNDITLAGRNLVARLFNKDVKGGQINRVSQMYLGSSKKAFNPADKALAQKIGQTEIKTIKSSQITDAANKPRMQLQLTGELGEKDCNGELREAGLFTTDGVMYNRVTFDTITKSNQFRLTLVWEVTF